jgi:hypothetical protein
MFRPCSHFSFDSRSATLYSLNNFAASQLKNCPAPFINGNSYSTNGKGYIGMLAEDMNGPTEVIYRNAKLWTF